MNAGAPRTARAAAVTAVGDAGGESADAAQAMLVTLWNAAMAAGGLVGGLLLDTFGSTSFPWTVLLLLLPVTAVVLYARGAGFPARRVSWSR
ncbi:MFS transporter [Streptomyces sp. SID7982]|nr:MFS transporter [Streptomyces sp. SID7982]